MTVKLTKQLNEEFKRSISWNEYKTKTGSRNLDDNNLARFCLMMLIKLKETVTKNIVFQEWIELLTICSLMADQPNNDQIKKYDEIRKTAARQGDGYTTGCLLDY